MKAVKIQDPTVLNIQILKSVGQNMSCKKQFPIECLLIHHR